ncbi:MAG TPA: histidine phosphatase family protein [Paracoccaceae bacterium]|nr:histidine phosphatase family protein [Paracoccaceae bacterium]
MPEIRLVRHAQASFGEATYDRLSALGHRQSRLLGERLAASGARPARVVLGTLTRHRETLEGIAAAYAAAGLDLPDPEPHPGWNEYDADALMRAHAPHLDRAHAKSDRRAHFRALGEALSLWQRGSLEVEEAWDAFETRTTAALEAACADAPEGEILAITSGGVIGQCAAAALHGGPEVMIRLHMQARNAGWSRLAGRPGRFWLVSFNEAPHLDAAPDAQTWS